MAAKELKDYSINDVPTLILDNVDSVIVVDSKTDSYRALKRNGIFENYIEETDDVIEEAEEEIITDEE